MYVISGWESGCWRRWKPKTKNRKKAAAAEALGVCGKGSVVTVKIPKRNVLVIWSFRRK